MSGPVSFYSCRQLDPPQALVALYDAETGLCVWANDRYKAMALDVIWKIYNKETVYGNLDFRPELELVPQDPADEPATNLLARIREARATAPKPKRGRRKKAEA